MKSANQQPRGQPGWRPLTVLVLLVVLAHVLVLRAAPAQLGSRPDLDALGTKTLTTRSIEATPPPEPAPTAAATPVKTTSTTLKKPLNKPVAQVNRAQAAPEVIASTPSTTVPELPVETAVSATATATPPPPIPVAAAPTAVVLPVLPAGPAAPPAGPKTTPVTAISLPGSVRLLYKVAGLSKNMNYQAESELAWKSNGDSYEAMMKVSAFLVGSRSMTSVGKITGSGLAPDRFADKFRAELAAHFDASKGKITFSANTPDAPWMEGAQDRVSVFFQLGGMLAANPAGFPGGSDITFLTIGPREADTWTFVIESEETLELMGVPTPVLKLTRKPRKEFDQKVEIWYAPSLGYLPVRNRITQQNGDFLDQQLTQVVK